jgi:hypothetical protein
MEAVKITTRLQRRLGKLARQTLIAEIRQELFDLADRVEQMGEGNGTISSDEQ